MNGANTWRHKRKMSKNGEGNGEKKERREGVAPLPRSEVHKMKVEGAMEGRLIYDVIETGGEGTTPKFYSRCSSARDQVTRRGEAARQHLNIRGFW